MVLCYNIDSMIRPILIVSVLALVVAIIFCAHYFLYASARYFFSLPPARQVWPTAAMLGLSSSLFIASFLVHFWENGLTRLVYLASSVWLGWLWQIILAWAVVWLVVLAWRAFGRPPTAALAGLGLAAALLASVYGLWNAQRPQLVRLTLPLADLPPAWQGKTVVHLSDIHLGAIYGPAFGRRLVSQTNEVKPAAVFITGDYFDGVDGRLAELGAVAAGFVAERGVYFVTGNHEAYLGADKAAAALGQAGVRHLANEAVVIDGLRLIGLDYPAVDQAPDLGRALASLAGDGIRPSILLYHEPRKIEQLSRLGVDLMLSGHTHRGQLWPFNHIVDRIYGVYAHGLNRFGDLLAYTSAGVGTWGPPLRLGNRPEVIAITLTSKE